MDYMQRLAGWSKKHDLTICFLQETCLSLKETNSLKMKGWERIYYINSHQRAGIGIMRQIDFKTKKKSLGTKRTFFIMIKGSIHQEDIVKNICAPNNRVPSYMNWKSKNWRKKINIKCWEFSTPLSKIQLGEKSTRK